VSSEPFSGCLLRSHRCLFPPPSTCRLAWLMDHSRGLVLNRSMRAPGIHFQHPDQPSCAATLPQTHPLKTRIATLLQALHFMRDWQVNPFYLAFATSRSLSSSLGIWTSVRPLEAGHTARAANGHFFQAPIINGWVFSLQGMSPHSSSLST
jgi:hypothetical protein